MIWTIALREIVTRGRSKGFLAINGLLFVAVVAAAVATSFLGGDDEAREVTIGIQGDGVSLVQALEVGNESLAPETVLVSDGLDALERGDIDVLFDGQSLTWQESPDFSLRNYIRSIAEQAHFAQQAELVGLDQAEIQTLFEEVEIEEIRLDGGDDDFFVRLVIAAVSGMATFMLLQIWGAFMLMGVIEEKSSKVVEVLLAQVRPVTLLTGKVLGLGALAAAQMLILILGMVAGLMLVQDIEVPARLWATLPLSVATFLLGFWFYATAFAGVGSMVSRQEDAQSAQLPVMMPLLIGYFIAVSSIENPKNFAVTVGSFIPFTSPVLLPFRTAMTDVPAWQVVLSLVILGLSGVVMIRLAGWIYRYSLLRTGTKVSWSELWRNRKVADEFQ